MGENERMDLVVDLREDLRLERTARVEWSEWSLGGVEKLN